MNRLSSFSLLFVLCLGGLPFGAFGQETAASISLKDFEIIAPSKVKVNESFDLTVRAIDNTGKKFDKYEGEIYLEVMSGGDPKKDMVTPIGEDGYKFQLSDAGEHKFQNGFTLKKAGKYTFLLFDYDSENVDKEFEIIAEEATTGPVDPVEIVIKEPATNITVTSNSIEVSGTSKETSSINLKLNGTKVKTIQTDKTGAFKDTIDGLKQDDNVIVAEVLDNTGKVVGTSQPVTIKLKADKPNFKELTIKDGGDTFFAGSSINFTGKGDSGLKLVQVLVGDKVAELKEDKNNLGTYTGVLKTSDYEGEFKAKVHIESQLGGINDFPDIRSFKTVTAKIEDVKVEVSEAKETSGGRKVTFTFALKPDLDLVSFFKIKYGKEANQYTKEVITFEKGILTKKDNRYVWFIPDVLPGDYFYRIIALDKDKKDTPVNSGELTFNISLDAAPTCFVEKITGIKVDRVSDTYSIIRWDESKDASAYQIFKRDASGEFAMIDEIKTNQYRVNVDLGAESSVYEDFRVRAICKNGDNTSEGAFSESVAVPTGPELIIFFALFIASGIAFILVRRGYLN